MSRESNPELVRHVCLKIGMVYKALLEFTKLVFRMAIPPRITNFFSALSLFEDEEKNAPLETLKPSSSSPVKKKKHRKSVQGRKADASKQPIASPDKAAKLNSFKPSSNSENSIVDRRLKERSVVEARSKDNDSTDALKEKVTPSYVKSEQTTGLSADVRQNESNAAQTTGADGKDRSSFLKWPLVWIDLEMTGLDLERDRILEIACVITDGKLQKMIEGPDLIINQPEELLRSMGEWCQTHHTANGLVEGVLKSNVTEQQAEQEVLEFVHQHTGPVQPLLAGNCIYVDFMFLRKYMPNLAALFPHVVVDVSSIKALCLRWFPRDADRAPKKEKKHRALEDIKESIAELRYMQKTIFKQSKQ